MKRLILFIILTALFIPGILSADENEQDAFSAYKPIYFIVGMGETVKTRFLDENSVLGEEIETYQMVKLNFSMKYQFFHQYKTGIYLGFSQVMFWDLFNNSSPFSELNYNPDLFWRFESKYNFADDVNITPVDYIQLGVEHKSNGLAGVESRGFDRIYGQLQLGVGEKAHISLNAKYFAFFQDFLPDWYVPEMIDLPEYRSNWEFALEADMDFGWLFFIPDTIRLEVAPGGGWNAFDFTKGYQKLDVVFGDVFGGMAPYVQVWRGYGEGMIAYDEQTLSIRAGIMLR